MKNWLSWDLVSRGVGINPRTNEFFQPLTDWLMPRETLLPSLAIEPQYRMTPVCDMCGTSHVFACVKCFIMFKARGDASLEVHHPAHPSTAVLTSSPPPRSNRKSQQSLPGRWTEQMRRAILSNGSIPSLRTEEKNTTLILFPVR